MKVLSIKVLGMRVMRAACLLLALSLLPRFAAASSTCSAGGRGNQCLTTSQCASNTQATVCVDRSCQIPCMDAKGDAAPYLCSFGETCRPVEQASGQVYYCQPIPFSVDLNLLDMCVRYFVDGVIPDVSTTNECSLQANMNAMLDQDGNGVFDIFDVDGCIRAYFNAPGCDEILGTCPPGRLFCSNDLDCGDGSFCDPEISACQRECGLVGNRETNGAQVLVLDRPCFGSLKTCNYDRGRCEPVNLHGFTCMNDKSCPQGAYCFLGQCAPTCTRSLDCPNANWYCTTAGRCAPKPAPSATAGTPFVPKDYSVQFAEKTVSLAPLEDEHSVPIAIMDLQTKRQVFDRPEIVFGYRLEVTYGTKQAPRCMKPKSQWTTADIADCLIDDTEEFVTLENPFGTLFAVGTPSMGIRLNRVAADRLTPGIYQATITATYDNGGQDSTTVVFHKTTMSGDYAGRMSVYVDGPKNPLGTTNVSLRLLVDTSGATVVWDDILRANNLNYDSEFVDVTEGYPVKGVLHGNESAIFVNPGAQRMDQNDIPMVGLYSPALRRLRVIGVIEEAPNDCHSDEATCGTASAAALKVTNIFGRRIRRVLQFIGLFDATKREWNGTYRETLSGLAPHSFTLDGEFVVRQTRDDDSGLPLTNRLQPHGSPLLSNGAAVVYPNSFVLMTAINNEIDNRCALYPDAKSRFVTQGNFDSYIAALDYPTMRAGRILPDLVNLKSRLGEAINTLGGDGSGAALTLYDYLRGQVFLCPDNAAASAGSACIDKAKIYCGLALERKAVMAGYVDLASIEESSQGYDLFCSPTSALSEGCSKPAMDYPTLTTLQEYNRFYSELVQALNYQAQSELSDALYLMYRLQGTTGTEQAVALSNKQAKLLSAWRHYEELRTDIFSPVSTAVLFGWPMAFFKERGRSLLDQIHSIMDDRLEVLAELVDLKRRVFVTSTGQDFVFVKHLLHYEYLSHALLTELQRTWEKEEFLYSGGGPAMLEHADLLLAKVNQTRNPLGFLPEQIFFENSDLSRVNWENYRQQIGTRTTGLLGEVNTAIETAVSDLHNSLTSKNAMQSRFLAARQEFERNITSICGPENPPGEDATCPALPVEERQKQVKCEGTACLFQRVCESEDCANTAKRFAAASSGSVLKEVACRVDTPSYAVQVSVDPRVPLRSCVRGQMGALLQEKVQLELQRKQIYTKVKNLLQQVEAQSVAIKAERNSNQEVIDYLNEQSFELGGIQMGLDAANFAYDTAAAAADGLDIFAIFGTANGTNAPGKIAAAGAMATAIAVKYGVSASLEQTRDYLLRSKEIYLTQKQQDQALRSQVMALNNLMTDIENLIAEYETITQQLFNLQVRLADTLYTAKQAAQHYRENLNDVVESLVGGDHGNLLRRNQKVMQANEKFLELLRLTYKMTMAFIHSYNLEANAKQLTEQVFRIVTPSGVEEFISRLDQYQRDYCGSAGIDCDSANNTKYFRFSFRDELFPSLSDVVDARTGAVLTKGQQFHNIITSSQFRHKRYRGSTVVDQIELPFSVWLNDTGPRGGAERQWMLSPLECNHIIVGRGSGTLAVNVNGANLTGNINYELWRGNTDFLRACEAKPVTPPGGGSPHVEYAISPYIVGYAPQSALAQQSEPPTFTTHSSAMPACERVRENSQGYIDVESCYQFFARDRSLAAPDWSLVIPITGGANNQWILGEGLPEAARPVIEDIVLYVRYRTRPIQ